MTKRIVGVAIVAALLLGALFLSQWRTEPFRVSGFIEADEIRVGSRVGGRVLLVKVAEGQPVKAGDLLVELEPFDLSERRAEAVQVLREQRQEWEKLRAGYREEEIAQAKSRRDKLASRLKQLVNGPRPQEIAAAKSQLDLANANLALAIKNHQRVEALLARQAATQDDLDQAVTELKVARAEVEVREENLSLLKAGTRREEIEQAQAELEEAEQGWKLMKAGYRKEDVARAEAAVEAAQAALEAIERQIEELKVRAPVDATVEAVDLRPGDLVGAGAPSISLLETGRLWVRAYVPENRLDLEIDQRVDVTVDSFPGRTFQGRISFIARQAEFTPGNVQTPEERSKQVFRIKVVLTEHLDELRPGMQADVWLDADAP